jgi:hypothetical protein
VDPFTPHSTTRALGRARDEHSGLYSGTRDGFQLSGCVFLGRSRIPDPTLETERWLLSGCYRKAFSNCTVSKLRRAFPARRSLPCRRSA